MGKFGAWICDTKTQELSAKLAELDEETSRAVFADREKHDEAMRMQAMEIGSRLWREVVHHMEYEDTPQPIYQLAVKQVACWAYHEATGREW